MRKRDALILLMVAVLSGPVLYLAWPSGPARPKAAAPARGKGSASGKWQSAPRVTRRLIDLHGGCRARRLTAGITNDADQGAQYDQEFLSPFAAHPPIPDAKVYPPGRGPDPAALLHALYHGAVVVRYNSSLAGRARELLGPVARRDPRAPIFLAGSGMPMALLGVSYGHAIMCAKLNATVVEQLREWMAQTTPQG